MSDTRKLAVLVREETFAQSESKRKQKVKKNVRQRS